MNATKIDTNQPENQLFAEVMSDSTKGSNRQAKLVVMMFENEVSYTLASVSNFFRKEGKDRTILLETSISEISSSYADVLEQRNVLQERKKSDKDHFTTSEALQLEGTLGKLKAARELYTRAITAVYHLRKVEAFNLKLGKSGSLSYYVYAQNEKGEQEKDPKGNPISTLLTVSGNTLYRSGDKDVRKDFGKKTTTQTRDPSQARDGIAPVVDVVTNRLKKARAEGKFLPDLKDEEEKSVEALLRELILAKFADDTGVVDADAVDEYVEGMNAAIVAAKNISGNGKNAKTDAKADGKSADKPQPAAA